MRGDDERLHAVYEVSVEGGMMVISGFVWLFSHSYGQLSQHAWDSDGRREWSLTTSFSTRGLVTFIVLMKTR